MVKLFMLQSAAECHAAENANSPEVFFTLDSKNANPTYVAHKVHGGSIMMAKFPNIKGSKMRALSQYVVDHSFRH